jgi:hypothetical protein
MAFDCFPPCEGCVALGECRSDESESDTETFDFECAECDAPQDGGGTCDDVACDGSVEMVTE